MVMMDDKALFVDTNILINANIIETPFHEQALFSINTAYPSSLKRSANDVILLASSGY